MYDRFERATERALHARGLPAFLSKKDRTVKDDLLRIWSKLTKDKMGKLSVIWDYKYDKKTMWDHPVIMNLGNPLTVGGSHWIAVWRNKYFDSFGLPPSDIVLANGFNGTWNKKQIQGVSNGNCGQYCCLWLFYVMQGKKGEEEFYKLF